MSEIVIALTELAALGYLIGGPRLAPRWLWAGIVVAVGWHWYGLVSR